MPVCSRARAPCCSTSSRGSSVVSGIQLGNVWVGVQVRGGHGMGGVPWQCGVVVGEVCRWVLGRMRVCPWFVRWSTKTQF